VVYAGLGEGADAREVACRVRGRLKLERSENRTLVAVGDRVRVRVGADGAGIVEEVLERRTLLARKWVMNAERLDPVVANADLLCIVVSVNPVVKPGIVDRYLVAGIAGGLSPVIVLNKIDLPEASRQCVKLDVYRSLGYRVIETSAKSGVGLDALESEIIGKTAAFCGHSGVGKSSILNRIFDFGLKVGDVAGKTLKGRHTTTHVKMLANPAGGWVIDTPGIRSFGVAGVHSEDLIQLFPELYPLTHKCEFRDCTHAAGQKGCAIAEAVARGEVTASRLESWAKLRDELAAAEVW
jgi:ribosome biogenesis GTPase